MSEHTHSTDAVEEVDTGPFTISYRTHVAQPPSELWSLAANPHRHHELDGSGTLSTKVTGPAQLAQGDVFNVWMRRFGLPYTIPMRVLTAVPAQEVSWQHPTKHIWRWTFSPTDDGGSWVTETFDYTQVSPLLLRGWNLLQTFVANARDMRASLQSLHDQYARDHDA